MDAVSVVSFGFRYCSVPVSDMSLALVIDLRCLPRPWEGFDADTVRGTDKVFATRLFQNEDVATMWPKVVQQVDDFLQFAQDAREAANKAKGTPTLQPTIVFGCRSGLHRSVAFAERMAETLRNRAPGKLEVKVTHRDAALDANEKPLKQGGRKPFAIVCKPCGVTTSAAASWNQHIRYDPLLSDVESLW